MSLAVVPLVTLVTTFLTPLEAEPPDDSARFTLRGEEVAVFNLVGRLEVVAGQGDAVEAVVRRGGRDAAQLRVENGALDGRPTLRVIYPFRSLADPWADDGRGWEMVVRVREDGTFGRGGGGGAGRRVMITDDDPEAEAWADIRLVVPRGKRVALHLAVGDVSLENVDGDVRIESLAADVSGKGLAGSLRVRVASGGVELTEGSATVSIETGSGDVGLRRTRGADVRVRTGSGAITAADVQAEQLELSSGSGQIAVRGSRTPDLEARVGSGTIDVALAGVMRRTRLSAGSGMITLRVPEGVGADLEMSTGSGPGVAVDLPIEVEDVNRHHVRGRIGAGGPHVRASSGSGGIRVVADKP
ncbi:MAG TPA: DUF4097 family beta strand repeat-containing protein [Gemmatimonadaceae bacterium]|nr:DUF4097 family beta strand repeat-containing protein [Gemmatimonadaceae bacterium]